MSDSVPPFYFFPINFFDFYFFSYLFRENDSLLGQLSQSMMRSEEVPIALAAIKVQYVILLNDTMLLVISGGYRAYVLFENSELHELFSSLFLSDI